GRALEGSLAAVELRHEALRTRFHERDGQPLPAVDPAPSFALPRVDLSGLGGAAGEAEARRLAEAEAVRPFDLARSVWRGCLLEFGGDERWLLVTLHHIASDGWSIGVLVRELEALYPAFAAGEA